MNPPEADLVGVEAVESQVAEDESLDRARSHAHSSLNREESPPDPPVSRTTPDGGYRSKYGSLSMPKGPTPFRRSQVRPGSARRGSKHTMQLNNPSLAAARLQLQCTAWR